MHSPCEHAHDPAQPPFLLSVPALRQSPTEQVSGVQDAGNVTIRLTNVSFEWPINPDTVPGNDYITATALISGDLVAR